MKVSPTTHLCAALPAPSATHLSKPPAGVAAGGAIDMEPPRTAIAFRRALRSGDMRPYGCHAEAEAGARRASAMAESFIVRVAGSGVAGCSVFR